MKQILVRLRVYSLGLEIRFFYFVKKRGFHVYITLLCCYIMTVILGGLFIMWTEAWASRSEWLLLTLLVLGVDNGVVITVVAN